jgi:hypothetical protein
VQPVLVVHLLLSPVDTEIWHYTFSVSWLDRLLYSPHFVSYVARNVNKYIKYRKQYILSEFVSIQIPAKNSHSFLSCAGNADLYIHSTDESVAVWTHIMQRISLIFPRMHSRITDFLWRILSLQQSCENNEWKIGTIWATKLLCRTEGSVTV